MEADADKRCATLEGGGSGGRAKVQVGGGGGGEGGVGRCVVSVCVCVMGAAGVGHVMRFTGILCRVSEEGAVQCGCK